MRQFVFDFFGYVIFFYSMWLISSYLFMMLLAGLNVFKSRMYNLRSYDRDLVFSSPYTPGVSIIAPAYNEEATIVENVKSLLEQDYPKFEVVIVNDGSTDSTLEKMIKNFDLEEVPFDYVQQIYTRPFKRVFKSKRAEFSRLMIVDKENGGTKADAVNAGLNAASYPYFINTDVDCILSRDAIFQCIAPILKNKNVIAVSGAMTMSNGCRVVNGKLVTRRAPRTPVPLFQTLEYMRSFFVGKMAWSYINSMPNVSGGYGLFDRQVMIAAGGYSPDSFAEDMEMLLDAIRYCCVFNRPYKVIQIPITCCWTEGPPNLRILYRQRVRWGRGLIKTFARHRNMVCNPKYRRMGMITLPYLFIFEFLGPIIEISGFFVFIYLAFTGGVNWLAALVIFAALYTFSLTLAHTVMMYDYISGGTFEKRRDYFLVELAAIFEVFMYHPFITLFSLIGYVKYLLNTRSSWGKMTRKGYAKIEETNTLQNEKVIS